MSNIIAIQLKSQYMDNLYQMLKPKKNIFGY